MDILETIQHKIPEAITCETRTGPINRILKQVVDYYGCLYFPDEIELTAAQSKSLYLTNAYSQGVCDAFKSLGFDQASYLIESLILQNSPTQLEPNTLTKIQAVMASNSKHLDKEKDLDLSATINLLDIPIPAEHTWPDSQYPDEAVSSVPSTWRYSSDVIFSTSSEKLRATVELAYTAMSSLANQLRRATNGEISAEVCDLRLEYCLGIRNVMSQIWLKPHFDELAKHFGLDKLFEEKPL